MLSPCPLITQGRNLNCHHGRLGPFRIGLWLSQAPGVIKCIELDHWIPCKPGSGESPTMITPTQQSLFPCNWKRGLCGKAIFYSANKGNCRTSWYLEAIYREWTEDLYSTRPNEYSRILPFTMGLYSPVGRIWGALNCSSYKVFQ